MTPQLPSANDPFGLIVAPLKRNAESTHLLQLMNRLRAKMQELDTTGNAWAIDFCLDVPGSVPLAFFRLRRLRTIGGWQYCLKQLSAHGAEGIGQYWPLQCQNDFLFNIQLRAQEALRGYSTSLAFRDALRAKYRQLGPNAPVERERTFSFREFKQ